MNNCQCDDLNPGTTVDVRLLNLVKSSTGVHIADATVTVTLLNANGTAVSGANALPMPYVGGDDLKYEGQLPSTLSLTAGLRYGVQVIAVASEVGTKKFPIIWKVCKE